MSNPRDEAINQQCLDCGGLHFGSGLTCPYSVTICDVCDKTLLHHKDYAFCEGGKTKHDAASKFCTCAKCVDERMALSRNLRRTT